MKNIIKSTKIQHQTEESQSEKSNQKLSSKRGKKQENISKYITQNDDLNNKIKLITIYENGTNKKMSSFGKMTRLKNSHSLNKLINTVTSDLKLTKQSKLTNKFSSFDYNSLDNYQYFENLDLNKDKESDSFDNENNKKRGSNLNTSTLFKSIPTIEQNNVLTYISSIIKKKTGVIKRISIEDKQGFHNPFNSYGAIRFNRILEKEFNSYNKKVHDGILKESQVKFDLYDSQMKYQKENIVSVANFIKNNDHYMNSNGNSNGDQSKKTINSIENSNEVSNKDHILHSKTIHSNTDENSQKKTMNLQGKKTSNSIVEQENKLSPSQKASISNEILNSIIPNNNYIVSLFAYFYYPQIIFPEGREMATICNSLNFAYLYGGVDTQMKNIIWEFNPFKMSWRQVIPSNYPCFSQRHSHSCVYYNNKLFIYGGKAKANQLVLFPELEIFDLENRQWLMPPNSTGPVKTRKNHIACVLGSSMIIHGGISEEGQILSDAYSLNFETCKFVPILISDYLNSPQRGYHSACLLAPLEVIYSNKNQLYNFELTKKKMNYQPGLYIFGGKVNEMTLSNEVYCLSLGKKLCEWVKIQTSGKSPCARYMSSMNFYEEANVIIVHGGRILGSQFEEMSLNDTYVLNMYKLEWYLVECSFLNDQYHVISRFGHSSFIYTDKLIVFGGSNDNNLVGSSFFIINLNKHKANSLISYQSTIKQYGLLGKIGKEKIELFKSQKRKISQTNVFSLPNIK